MRPGSAKPKVTGSNPVGRASGIAWTGELLKPEHAVRQGESLSEWYSDRPINCQSAPLHGPLFSYGVEAEKTFVRSAVSTPPSSTGLPAVEPCVEVQNGLNAAPTDPNPS
jgi:hypothetical protein